ncbi:MAG: class I SAM-dependent methyltransferase [Candidatus Liptonbacteria bacterium]|nr:class I SAM-dependent methyltransferase [Candidatus Liptonbacteria bacterium]
MTTKEISKRWENYRKANSDKPSARENELAKIFALINPKEGQRIWEVGTGNGYLTFPLAEAVVGAGQIITTDVDVGNIEDVIKKNKRRGARIDAILLSPENPLLYDRKYRDYFDIVATIATLHHLDNRKDRTGESGRKKALKYFYKNLKKGGKLVMADVLHGTISQKYFDAIDNPEHCYPLGHPHDFFTKKELIDALAGAGFKEIKVKIAYVPWKFSSVKEAKKFVYTIHNAKCTEEESFAVSKKYLGFKKIAGHYELGWELFFLTATK